MFIQIPEKIPNIINGVEEFNDNITAVPDIFDLDSAVSHVVSTDFKAIESAVNAASGAFSLWRNVPAPRRAEVLLDIAESLKLQKQRLAEIVQREVGKTQEESLGEVQEVIDSAIFFSGEGRRFYGHTTPSELPDKMCMTFHQPLGVVALVTPWNFPMAVPSWKLFAALISGNAIIFKPSELAPYCANALIEVLNAHLPAGLINVLHGQGGAVVPFLIEHEKIRMMSFTGSTQVGRIIMQRCGQYGKRVSVELGGNNAQIVLNDADIDLACKGALWGAFGTSGQRCTSTSRLIVQKEVYAEFTEKFVALTTQFIDIIKEDRTHYSPLRKKEQLDIIQRTLSPERKPDNVQILCGNALLEKMPNNKGLYFLPTVLAGVKQGDWIFQHEIFGPIVSIIAVDDVEEAIAAANNVKQGLSTSIYTHDVINAMRAIKSLDTGIVYVNAPTIGAEIHLPFGGSKSTGNGFRDSGVEALNAFTEYQAVYIDYSHRLQRAQIDNR